MKKTAKILSFSFIIVLCMAMLCFGTSAANENGILYSVSDGEATVTGVDETVTGDLVIPEELGGYPVTAIGDYAFEDNYEITSLVIPEGVETIGDYCFSYCRYLEKLWLPSTLEYVGRWAFDECFIYELHIPDIASYAQIDYEQVYSHPFCYDDEDGFEWWETEYEKELYIGDSTEPANNIVIPEGVTRIGNYAFHCNTFLKSVVLPDTLTEIGECAFLDCKSLETVSFGESLEHIDNKAFSACESLGNITLPDSLLTIGDWAFSLNNAMTEITVPDKVEIIPLGAFSECKALKVANLGTGVETICQQAFQNIGATEFVVPDNVKTIECFAFMGCNSLETVVIGNGVTTVGDMPFLECYNLKNVSLGNGLTELSEKFFKIYEHVDDTKDKWIKLESLNTGDGITALPTEVLDRSTLKEIVIGDGITEIADYQFTSFDKLEKVILGDNITSIGNEAFYSCTALRELKLPANLETVGNYAFCGCSVLPEIVIPDKVVSLGNSSFAGCSAAESVIFEGTALRTIGDGSFSGCSALTAIAIPDGVTHLGSNMFYWSENLREIALPDSITNIKSGLIYYTPYDEDYDYYEDMLYIDNHLINTGDYQTPAKYVVRKGTKSIAQYAFSNEHSLETVVIHKGLVSMDDDIFNDCPNLKTICFTGTEAEWNQILKGNNDFSAYTIEFNYYVCPHENTENKEAVAPGCNTYGYTEGIYCNGCNEWLKGHKQLAFAHKDNNGDAVCDICDTRCADIIIGERLTLPAVDFGHDLKFVAPATGEYTITSYAENYIDPWLDIFDADYNLIKGNSDISNDNCNFSITCTLEKGKNYIFAVTSLCSAEFDVLLTFDCEHTGGAATCKEKAECINCRMEYGELNSDNHSNIVTVPAVSPTCTKTGLTESKKCNGCGKVITEAQTVDTLGHLWGDWAQTKAPGCTVQGESRRDCGRCDAYETKPVAMTGHTQWSDWAIVVSPACEQSGIESRTCICGHSETREIPAMGHTDADGNNVCDNCNYDWNEPEEDNSIVGRIKAFFQKIIDFFKNLFKFR